MYSKGFAMTKSFTQGKKVEEIASEHPSKFPLANLWINTAYRWGNIEKQLFDLAISKPEKRLDIETGLPKAIAHVSVAEINALRQPDGQINYNRAKEAANTLASAYIRIEDRSRRIYERINMLERCTYDHGMYTIVFTDSFVQRGYIYPVKDHPDGGYTPLIQAVNILSDSYAIKFYQILRMHCFGTPDIDGNYIYDEEVDRLKFLMGFINPGDKAFLQSEKKYGTDSDDIAVINDLKGQKDDNGKQKVPYVKYNDFKRYVLDKYIKEINKEMDISVAYHTLRTSGKTVRKLRFYIKLNENKKPDAEELMRRLQYIAGFLTVQDMVWTRTQLSALLSAAGYSTDIVHIKYDLLLKQDAGKIRDRFSWLLSAIQNNYGEEITGTGDIIDEKADDSLDTFERLWQLYPKKTRSDLCTKNVKRDVNSVGFDKIKQAIDNYELVIEQNRKNGFNRSRMSGGAFFSGGYKDYLPKNFDNKSDEEKGYIKSRNAYTGKEQRTSMNYEELAEKEEMEKVLHGFGD